MRKLVICLCLCILAVTMFGCLSLSRTDTAYFKQIEMAGLDTHPNDVKSPALAACLNILPGIGNFYLASEHSEFWGIGILNLLTWPISIVWAAPEAAIDADIINKEATVYYYRFNPQGKADFEKATKQQ